jgi:hypothetical protein
VAATSFSGSRWTKNGGKFCMGNGKVYEDNPQELDETIIHFINDLAKEGLIKLSDIPVTLTLEFFGPIK